MAVAQSAYRSSINISNISKSVSSLGKGIKQAKSSALRTNTILLKSTRFKRESIARDNVFFQRRREAVRRKEQEDIIESSGIRGAFKRQREVIASSTKGFLGRIMDFVGTLMVGWLVNNLPLIIKLGEQVIQKIQGIVGALGGFISGVQQTLSGFGNLLGGVFSNVVQFKFSNIGTDISNSMNQITSGFESIEKSFDDALNLLKEPLDFTKPDIPQGGVLPRDGEIPPDQTNSPSSQPSQTPNQQIDSGPVPKNNREAFEKVRAAAQKAGSPAPDITAAIAMQETGWLQNPNSVYYASKKTNPFGQTGTGSAGYVIGADGQKHAVYKSFDEGVATHVRLWKNYYKGNTADEILRSLVAAGYNTASPGWRPNIAGIYEKMTKKPRNTPISVKGTSGPSPSGKPSVPTKPAQTAPAVTTSVQDQFKGKPGGAAGQITDVFGYSASRGRNHNGIDIAPAGPGYYVAFKQSGTVTYAQFNNGGYGNLVIIKVGNTEYYFAHLAKIMVKNGQSYNGQTIGEIGSTGGSTGIHLHFEVRPNGKAIDPRPYIGMLSIGKTLTGVAGQPTSITTSAKITAPSTGSTQQMKAMTPERSGPTVVVAQPQAPQMQAPMGGGGGGQSMPNVSSGEIELNRLMTQRLLLELAYT
jgi:murein DD-endopeptidase MepM/ murein hydrolase activator NlpD